MSDDYVSHEEIEHVVGVAPKALIDKLPDCIESREAKRLIQITEDLAHVAREKRRPT